MLDLPKVTLLAVATAGVEQAAEALKYSCRAVRYGSVKLVSHRKPKNLPGEYGFEYVPPMGHIDVWNHYLFYHLWKHVDTDFGLLIHEDGFVVHPESWRSEFLDYDYIGAPWEQAVAKAIQGGRDQELVRVGNSVSIRSRRLMKLPSEICIPWRKYNGDYNEDTQICAHNRKLFLQHGIKYAPLELAVHFSREALMPENQHITKPFAFHKRHHPKHPNWSYPCF